MAKVYNEEFKKQLVKEFIQGKRYPTLEKGYGVAKPTLSRWAKSIAENAWHHSHIQQIPLPFPQKKSSDSTKELQNWKRRTFS